MNKFIKTGIILLIILFASKSSILADNNSSCQVVYGGGQVCPTNISFTINKLVQSPTKGGDFVENLSINDPKFSPNSPITFQIVIKNTGNNKISNLLIEDTFPQFVNFEAGAGNFDRNTNKLSFNIKNFEAGQTQTFTVTGKIADTAAITTEEAIVCVTNKVKATEAGNVSASDFSQICIEKPVQAAIPGIQKGPGLKKIPSTGPEVFPLIGLAGSGILGYFLRKKTKLN
ncbi:MAG: LPXTG cell wall anchor domain-containing protein [Armatimonadetes bacterium]|nr:MAG: LPXTG cell wall anchor domain-containing protein [Armatimonadota bacterium]